jgi:rhamnopyranosyl-N-acetylglucosaminyl-diphospho-decaprenol beta-1,3/1,4-galactofuranosyltransferase
MTEPEAPSAPTPNADSPRLFGVLVTFRRPAALAEHLELLARQTRRVDHLVVVDNGGTPEIEHAVAARPDAAASFEYLATNDNLGPAGGIARGLTRVLEIAADEDWVVLLDDDNPPRRDDLLGFLYELALAERSRQPSLAMVGKTGARFDLRRGRAIRLRDDELSGVVPVDYVAGGQLPLIHVDALREVGVFDERFFFSFDDLDFGLRLREYGYRAVVDGSVAHWARARAGRLDADGGVPRNAHFAAPWRRYYSLRNLVYLLRVRGYRGAALRVSITDGLVKALLIGVRQPRTAWAHLRFTAKAIADGWAGRLGRRVAPVVRDSMS